MDEKVGVRLMSHPAQPWLLRCGDKERHEKGQNLIPAVLCPPSQSWEMGQLWLGQGRSSFVLVSGVSSAQSQGLCACIRDSKDTSHICGVGVKLPQNGAKIPACGAQAMRSSAPLL